MNFDPPTRGIVFQDIEVRRLQAGATHLVRLVRRAPIGESWYPEPFRTRDPLTGKRYSHRWRTRLDETRSIYFKSPFGKPGDSMYVREAWSDDGHYRADGGVHKFQPGTTMPLANARYIIQIHDLSIRRVHSLDRDDMVAEDPLFGRGGVPWTDEYRKDFEDRVGFHCWSSNPWVYVIKYKAIPAHGN